MEGRFKGYRGKGIREETKVDDSSDENTVDKKEKKHKSKCRRQINSNPTN